MNFCEKDVNHVNELFWLFQILFQPLFYGTVLPLLGWFALKKFLLDPWESERMQKLRKEQEDADLNR